MFLLFGIHLFAIEIDDKSSGIELLPMSSIYIDRSNKVSRAEIVSKIFVPTSKSILTLGFAPDSALWIKFRVKNKTNHGLEKIIEYANPLTEEIVFFDGNGSYIDGAWHIPKERTAINPLFKIELKANEERIFYIKAHSTISTTIAQLTLWNPDAFWAKDRQQKALILIFFTIMLTLLLYNSFIYLFTNDRAYLYYILYLLAIILNESTYSGVAQLYLLSSYWTVIVTKYIMLLTAFLILSILLFTREFLHTHKFKRLDMLLRIPLYLVPILSLLSCNNFLFNANIIILFLPLGFLVIFVGFYALFHGVKEARFYVIGWSMVLLALIVTNLQTLGILNINEEVKYLNDFSFIAETFLFSIALAHRIKINNERVFALQQGEQQKLERLVATKTYKLQRSLEKEELLYRELNHRVKNNFQMILSLIKLQILKSSRAEIKSELMVIRDRINAIAELYEILQIEKESGVSTQGYFEKIMNNISQGFNKKVEIEYQIFYKLPLDKLIYCGLILNELVTNSFKYAFEDEGKITISLYREEQWIYLIIKDNGRGYTPREKTDSLGMLIVQTLVDKQLLGRIQIENNNGVESRISWRS